MTYPNLQHKSTLKKARSLRPLAILSCLLLLLTAFSAQASSWKHQRYERFVKDENLVTLLMDFSSTLNVPMVVDERVQLGITERVNGHFKGLTAEAFLNKLSTLYQITWYFDGHVLYIYHSDQVSTLMVYVDAPREASLKETMRKLGVYDPRFKWNKVESENLIYVSGPPRYLTLVKEVRNALQYHYQRDATYTVRVFPLRYASAADQVLRHRGSKLKVPGVATLLKGILGHNTNLDLNDGDDVTDPTASDNGEALSGLRGTGLSSKRGSANNTGPQTDLPSADKIVHEPQLEKITIHADATNNTVIVHDLENRMKMYEELIASFDKPSLQVEIEVSIVEVSTDRMDELGVDWQLKDNNGAFGVGNINRTTRSGGGTILSPDVGNISTILQNNGNYFLGRVRALSENGDGQVLSRPSVITMNNQEAVIDNTTTFYVRLEGQEEVDLVPVSVGSVLRVRPRVIEDEGVRKIMLNVSIEDGQDTSGGGDLQTRSEVDGIPTVSKSTITTQAVIEESSSLLVGGFFLDQRRSRTEKVPVLGDIPGLGRLFRSDNKDRRKNARLFMISPKIVNDQFYYEDSLPIKEILDKHQNFQNVKYQEPDYFIYE